MRIYLLTFRVAFMFTYECFFFSAILLMHSLDTYMNPIRHFRIYRSVCFSDSFINIKREGEGEREEEISLPLPL